LSQLHEPAPSEDARGERLGAGRFGRHRMTGRGWERVGTYAPGPERGAKFMIARKAFGKACSLAKAGDP
jgi:hypothetical protein